MRKRIDCEEVRKMKSIKKLICYISCLAVVCGCLTGCGKSGTSDDDEFLVVTTSYAAYDWAMNIIGKNPADARVVYLLDDGVDMHSYQPTVDDLMTVSKADVFIYVGGESDEWVEDAVKNMKNDDAVIINMMESLGDKVYEEETVEGMQEEEHHHDHDADEDEDHDHHHEEGETEYDEHIWLSLKNAKILTDVITVGLMRADEKNASLYRENADAYKLMLDDLDWKYTNVVNAASQKTLLFADRFPFRYMVSDYGLEYYAAFSGCSSETEASFDTVIFLAKKVDELGLNVVLTVDGSGDDVAKTVVNNTASGDKKILEMNSMQSVAESDIANGSTYLSIMEDNLAVLTQALQ